MGFPGNKDQLSPAPKSEKKELVHEDAPPTKSSLRKGKKALMRRASLLLTSLLALNIC